MTPQKRVCFGWKGVRPGVRVESRSDEQVRSPKNTSGIKKGFEGIHDRFQKDFRCRHDRRSASRWTSWHRKISPIAHQLRSLRGTRKTRYLSLNTSGRNAPMKLRSDFREALTNMHRLREKSDLHQFFSTSIRNGIRRLLHPASWWQWNDHF